MRLLIVTQYFWPENFRINELVSELVKRGHTVTVLTGMPNYPDGIIFSEFKSDPDKFSHFSGAEIKRVPLYPRGRSRFGLTLNYVSFALLASIMAPWKLRGQKFDAIFAFGASPITAVLPATVMRYLRRIPLLLWVLDLWPESLSAVGVVKSERLLTAVGKIVSFIYSRCDRILGQSRAFEASFQKYQVGDRVRYFPGWTEGLFKLAEDDRVPAAELAVEPNVFKILFAGNIGDAQDFPSILDAADSLKHRDDLRWFVVGDGRGAQYLREEISRRGLEGKVVMLGRFSLERMPSFFCAADALLVALKADPIFSLTIPAKVQSYMGVGVPLLGMLDGEGAKVIFESGGGLVSPASDGLGLARNVTALMNMSVEQRLEMGRKARDYGRREFDRDALIDSLELHLQDAVRQNYL